MTARSPRRLQVGHQARLVPRLRRLRRRQCHDQGPGEASALRPENVASCRESLLVAHTGIHVVLRVSRRARPRARSRRGSQAGASDLTVIVTGGDGDGYSIGGNHFLHACRRNAT